MISLRAPKVNIFRLFFDVKNITSHFCVTAGRAYVKKTRAEAARARLFLPARRPFVELDVFIEAGVFLFEHIAPFAAGELHAAAAGEDFREAHLMEGVALAAYFEGFR